jgi:hypothetical protein
MIDDFIDLHSSIKSRFMEYGFLDGSSPGAFIERVITPSLSLSLTPVVVAPSSPAEDGARVYEGTPDAD